MGLIESNNPEVKTLKGLHLYHYFLSNCSQRVRLALEEKGLDWTSHPVDLASNEHATAWYQSINPNGLVPALIHDGQVIVESNDILEYLDEHFPEPSLSPVDATARAEMSELMRAAGAIQPANKALSHDRLFRPFRKLSAGDAEEFGRNHRNAELVEFMRDFLEDGEAWRVRVSDAEREMERAVERLESVLCERPWLSGDRFGLADISWSVNAHRLVQIQYDLSGRPRLLDWYRRVAARSSFDRAVVNYPPGS